MARLPKPGGDNGSWGDILNDYLSQALDTDGTIKDNAVTANTIAPNSVTNAAIASDAVTAVSIADGTITNAQLADGTIQEAKLAPAVQAKIDAATGTADWSAITNKPAVIAAGTDQATARSSIGAGTSNLILGTTSSTAKAGDYAPTKSDVGLGNVDNTSDANKPLSTAMQTALNLKLNSADLDSQTASNIAASGSNTRAALATVIGTSMTTTTADVAYSHVLRHVAGRGLISDTRSDGIVTSATSRVRFPLPEAVTAVRLVWSNFYVPSGSGETTNAYTLTIKASVEDTSLIGGRTAGTTLIPVFFNGKRSTTLEAGGILVSDPVYINTPDSWALFVRTYVSVTSGDRWPTPYPTSTTASIQTDGSGVNEGVTTGSDLTDSGSLSGSSAFAFGPTGIVADARSTAQEHAVLLAGDSITKRNGVINAVGSYQEQSAMNAGLPTMRVACGGEAFSFVKSQANYWRRMQLARFSRHVISGYGINDVRNGSSLATLQADAIAVWTMFDRLGLQVHQTTLLPNPGASTDGYLTASGQSIVNSGWESVRTGFNTWLRSGQATTDSGGVLKSVIDGAALCEVNSAGTLTLNGGFWKPLASVATVSGTASAYTTTTVTDSTKTRTLNQDQSLALYINSASTGAGQIASIKSNTATAGTVWTISAITLPTGTVTYQVAPSPTWDHLHPTQGLHDLVTAGLNLSYLKSV